jgi:carbamoyl-phosphate synthase large subunit
VYEHSGVDPWFLVQIEDLVREEQALIEGGLEALDAQRMRRSSARALRTGAWRTCWV